MAALKTGSFSGLAVNRRSVKRTAAASDVRHASSDDACEAKERPQPGRPAKKGRHAEGSVFTGGSIDGHE